MKLRLMRDDEGHQILVISLNERQDGEAFEKFYQTDTGLSVADKFRALADTIETEAKGG